MATRMLLTINMRRYLVTQPRTKRKNKALKYLRERISHYTRTDIENVLLSQELAEMMMKSHARKMSPVRLSVKIENGKATAEQFKEDRAKEPAKPEAKPKEKEAKKEKK
ncbi:MAG TPA: hypothetical protein VL944_01170 [Candidatus Acidoferrum sp.]|nr:hypothetical protein [Candidatus Acidoferrum sp.]